MKRNPCNNIVTCHLRCLCSVILLLLELFFFPPQVVLVFALSIGALVIYFIDSYE